MDRYELHQLLGEGGYGAVYRARHTLTEQWVALKVLRRDGNAEAFDRLVREARAVAQLGSAHVVRVFDAGIAPEGYAFIAMELLNGADLAELVRREGPFGIDRSIDLVTQILEGLAVAHERGIVHRDMKPANVFVTRTEQGHDFVKLLDFGISKMRSAAPLTAPGLAMGTPGYMAPEQIGNAHSVDGRSDLFSVAVILYELLTRQKPFSTRSYHEFVEELQAGRARPIRELAPAIPEALAAVVERGLARDPDGRWQSARAFATALRGASYGTPNPSVTPQLAHHRSTPPVSVTAPTMMAPSVPPPKKKRANLTPLFIAAGVLFAAIAGGAIVHYSASSTPVAVENAKKVVKQPEPEEEAPPEPEKPEKKKPAVPGSIAKSAGVEIEEPNVVGDLDNKEIRRVLKKALPEMDECRRAKDEKVMAAVHVHPVGKITLAGVAPDNKGDENAARCVAQRFKEAASGWKQGADDSGIIFFEVALKAK
jgi:eukaryotic-like serine/threonine-protein kinase